MAKTVNASVVFTRDGKTEATNLDKLGYATFVAIQAACVAELVGLASWGVQRVAAAVDGGKSKGAGGESDLRVELKADFGAGTSDVSLSYTGIAAADADEITGKFKAAVNGVLKG
jgi:hypothetical protein